MEDGMGEFFSVDRATSLAAGDRILELESGLRCAENARYNAEGRVKELETRLGVARGTIGILTEDNERLITEIALFFQSLAMKDARIGELKSILASTPVAFEDPDEKPKPKSSPFREFPNDRRRMGP
jgi:hypothetical protein